MFIGNYKIISGLFFSGLLAACGGGSDSVNNDEQPGGSDIDQIQVTSLSGRGVSIVEPGESIRISLDTVNPENVLLTYDWQVGDDIEFTGQNTDTIVFTAPDTAQSLSVSFSVGISLEDGTLLGNRRDQSAVLVKDPEFDYRTIVSPTTFISNRPEEVSEYDLNIFSNGGVWEITTAYLYLAQQGINIESSKIVTALELFTNGEYGYIYQGLSSVFIVESYLDDAPELCGEGTYSSKYYQSTEKLIKEEFCDGEIVWSFSIEKILNDSNESFGSVSLNIGNYPEIIADSDFLYESLKVKNIETGNSSQFLTFIVNNPMYVASNRTSESVTIDNIEKFNFSLTIPEVNHESDQFNSSDVEPPVVWFDQFTINNTILIDGLGISAGVTVWNDDLVSGEVSFDSEVGGLGLLPIDIEFEFDLNTVTN